MDKDMERLGKERLKRVKRRRQLATFVISMAVIVLSITVYRLIQPASAADQNKAVFTVDGVDENYVNLAKLTTTHPGPTLEAVSDKPANWNGEQFELEAKLSFSISKDESKNEDGTINNNYYYVYDPSVTIPDELCDKWVQKSDDKDVKAFQYRFVKNSDGTYAVLIKFNDGYIDNSDIDAFVQFEALGKGEVDDSGNVTIKIGGDATLNVDKGYVKWNGNKSINYDISVEKKNTTNDVLGIDENGRRYAEYAVEVKSEKGTPDDITLTDVFQGNGMKVDTSSFTYTITKNGNTINDPRYTATTEQDANNSSRYNLTATLPKLGAGESCMLTYRYYISNTDELNNGSRWDASNMAAGESTDKNTNEKVIDTSSSKVTYEKKRINKSGKYDQENNRIQWTINVNEEGSDIAGAALTDDLFKDITDIKISPEKGYDIKKDSNGKITSIDFKATDGKLNCNKYTITYYTDAKQGYNKQVIKNNASLSRDGHSDGTSTDVTVPPMNQEVFKKLTGSHPGDNNLYTLDWESGFTIPKSGIPSGTEMRDYVYETSSGANDHYMTYAQAKAYIDQIEAEFGGYIAPARVNIKDGEKSETIQFSYLDKNKDYKITDLIVTFNKDYPGTDNEEQVSFKYSTTADCSTPGSNKYSNGFKVFNVQRVGEFYHTTSSIRKMDGNQSTSQTDLKTTNCDGYLTWIVDVLMDADATDYTITDTMPAGVTVDSVKLNLKWLNEGESFAYDKLDGTIYNVTDANYWTSGVQTSTKVTQDGDHYVVETNVKKPDGSELRGWEKDSHIYITYRCKITDFENIKEGTTVKFENKASAKSNSNSNIGSSSHIQTVSKPKQSSDDKPVIGDKEVSKSYEWDDNEHRLRYTVIINPEGKQFLSNGGTLSFKDVLTYANKTYSTDALWQMDIMPASVKFREAIKQEDGTYKAGDTVEGCTWTYDAVTGEHEYDKSTRTINASVPDGKAIMLTYTYQVNATILGTPNQYNPVHMEATNTASLEGIEKGSDQTDTKTVYTESKTSAGIDKSNTFILYKVDERDYGILLGGAEFDLYKYENGQYSKVKTYTTDKNGQFEISLKKENLTYNTQYYVVETKAPDGYILPDDPEKIYFYFTGDTTKYPVSAENGQLQGSSLSDNYLTEYYKDQAIPTTSIDVNKKWTDSEGKTIIKNNGKIFLQLHQVDSSGNDKKYGDAAEVTADENGNWSYTFKDLPLTKTDEIGHKKNETYKYYVEEVGIGENNNMSGYEVSYVYKDQNGNNVGSTGSAVSAGKSMALDGGTIEITNKLNEYKLPETGGSGNRWLYMLSGVVLMAIAAITLFYKKQKLI